MIDVIKKQKLWLIAIGFAALNIILSLRYVGVIMFDQDPWIALYGAQRILEGQLLYKNFFDFVTPGTDYVLAALFSVFGTTLTVAHLTIVLLNAVVTILIVVISFDIIKNKWLRVVPGLLFSLYSSNVYYVSHHWFILLPVILALFVGVRIVKRDTGKPSQWLYTGFAAAGAFLFIQTIGVTLFGMLVMYIVWYYRGDYSGPVRSDKMVHSSPDSHDIRNAVCDQRRILSRSMLYHTAGFIIPVIFVGLVFAASGSLHAFIYDSFIWPFSHYRAINLSTPSDIVRLWIKELSSDGIVLGLIYSSVAYSGLIVSFVVCIYAAVHTKKNQTEGLALIALASFISTGIIAGLLPNPPVFHLMVFMPVYLMVIIASIEYIPLFRNHRVMRVGIAAYFIVVTLLFIYNTSRFIKAYYNKENTLEVFKTPIGNVKMYKHYRDFPYDVSYPYPLIKNLNIKLPRHIFVVYWTPSIYMLTGTDNPTPLNTYMPSYNTVDQAEAVIHALKADRTKVIIIDDRLRFLKKVGWFVHNKKMLSADNPLIRFVDRHYCLEKVVYGFKIYRLNRSTRERSELSAGGKSRCLSAGR